MPKKKVPPLTLEDLGVPTPETNREHIARLYEMLNRIIIDLADLKEKEKLCVPRKQTWAI